RMVNPRLIIRDSGFGIRGSGVRDSGFEIRLSGDLLSICRRTGPLCQEDGGRRVRFFTASSVSSRKHFIWAFVIVTLLMAAGCIFAVWLVYHLVGPGCPCNPSPR